MTKELRYFHREHHISFSNLLRCSFFVAILLSDKFDTSWGRIHFHLFECVANDDHQQMLSTIEKDKKSIGPVRSIGRAQSNFSSQIMDGAQSGKPPASKQLDEENQDDDQIEHSDEDDQCVKEEDSDLEVQ